MTRHSDELERIRLEIEAIPRDQRTKEQKASLALACRGLDLPEPPESLEDLAKAVGGDRDTDTDRPPAKRDLTVGGVELAGFRALSGTLSDVFTTRLGTVLEELDRRGYGPRGPIEGSLGERGRSLYHQAAELRCAFDGFAAAARLGLQCAAMSNDDRRSLYHRVSEVERELGAFLAEMRQT